MMMKLAKHICYLFIVSLSWSVLASDRPPQRLALIIGNASYAFSPLKNPLRDAYAVNDALQSIGFTTALLKNASMNEIVNAVEDFYADTAENDIRLFYYAGHAIQINGKNYLIPIHADLKSQNNIEEETYNIDQLMAAMNQENVSQTNIVILDACRNNPFLEEVTAQSGNSRSIDRGLRLVQSGLASIKAPPGTFVAYATEPGMVAEDGEGSNGTYTKHLLKHIRKPRTSIEDLFKLVRKGVMEETDFRQVPWEHSSLYGDIFFVSPTVEAAEKKAWQQALDDATVAAYKAFLAQYPQGLFYEQAEVKLEELLAAEKAKKSRRAFPGF
ncbi:caspase family protein [Alteromonas lipolytica]|uniref:Caspase family p20 domain-containing protein n=1 Tax=Alteromonas lipolytica TaxID=1856405 RepID=A0A1E8FB23_9ALTE|nr:caspase family protein [Alteromonas lipolytica]OFI32808.1 hypothetical protein BFC17_06595 [Alteromonas lipolytica]GGF72814.1 hypothetical protein GCM10011338_26240 [Alteromonas lipolytica]